MKKALQFIFHRLVIVAVCLVVQLIIVLAIIMKFNEYFVYFYGVCIVISVGAVLYIIGNKSNPAYKIAWIIPILLFPIFGGLLYLMFGNSRMTNGEKKRFANIGNNYTAILHGPQSVLKELEQIDVEAANQARYIQDYAGSPLFKNTSSEYLPLGEVKFERMLEELKKAEHFIFLEYFIIQEGKMWNTILDVLEEKAKQGIDVRVIYDDMGCILLLPNHYERKLEARGIKCCVFNPFVPVLSTRLNNRDHRKICVIDGHTGFTGGINLADEYINAIQVHGHWKDTSVVLKGDAVWNLTVMFLSMWDYMRGQQEDYTKYRPRQYAPQPQDAQGYVQPFTDSPLDGEAVGENVYMNLLNAAKRYVYITTPYLIISNEMATALCLAAKRGVDVRIVTPHIGDKWFVHMMTRACYPTLVESGVKIYEYTPGFIHAKTFLADDEYGVVGTINLDYRSLYLHFECAAWMYRTSCLTQMRTDYEKLMEVCQPVTLTQCKSVKWPVRLCRSVLRVFAPLM